MSEVLLLRLATGAEQPIHWLHWDQAHQQTLAQGQLANAAELNQLTSLAIKTPCYALVPNSAVLTTDVRLPNDSRAARDAIPYQLEEQLCEDIELLHFATGSAIAPGHYPVAVVSRSLMNHWSSWLHAAAIPVNALLVDAQTIAVEPGQCQAICLLDQILLRHSPGHSLSFPCQQSEQWLSLAENRLGCSIELPDLADSATNRPGDDGLQPLAACFAPDTAIDLLQGRYKLKDPVKMMLQAWKLPASLIACIIVLQATQLLWNNHQLNQQKQQLDQQVSQLFKQAMPGRRLVNPKVQIDTELQKLQRDNQGSPFIRILQQALPAFNGTADLTIQTLSYQADTHSITVALDAPNHDALETFTQLLKRQQLQAQTERSRQQGGRVSGQITIRGER